ncbi:hypothetical protein NADFUDRAFT_81086 [Nadsonia fulvescens var. elongata DSM 6958]|uniref:Ataxin-10 domain-containing protein n=1 Tax=Nadsonia fulvescens var. elongata DSM 6958 TaxID=857566 RepID=A0A1E3PT30_9ASCO|nr:hypothetical protein NADFUDRAFT_81086 [Nadsonia fulvescens var. elongata DSM 6958]
MDSINVLKTLDELVNTDSYEILYNLELLIKLKEATRITKVSNLITLDLLKAFVEKYFGPENSFNDIGHFSSTLAQRMELFTIISNIILLNQSQQFTQEFHYRDLTRWAINDLVQWSDNKNSEEENDYKHLTITCRVLFLASLSERKILTEVMKESLDKGSKAMVELLQFFASNIENDPKFLLDGGNINENIFVQLSLVEILKVMFNLLCNFSDIMMDTLKPTTHSVVSILSTIDRISFEFSSQLIQQLQHIFVCLPIERIADLQDFNVFVSSLFRYINYNLLTEESFKKQVSLSGGLDEVDVEISSKLSILIEALKYRCARETRVVDVTNCGEQTSDSFSLVASLILPSKEDRKEALGLADLASAKTLSSKLLCLLVDPFFSKSKDVMYELYWLISDKKTDVLIKNIGFGLASYYLLKKNIDISENWKQNLEAFETTDSASGSRIDPVTGIEESNNIKNSARDSLPPMTDEENEREAERLFVLFERIKANGVINIENPIAKAFQDTKLQEMS